ncbi:MAG: methyltransferase domain-containing protein [Gemmatimonadaceae bacterium]|nr:methyltransferase domain-containing protein [Gemmatimonadaceae bacterium]
MSEAASVIDVEEAVRTRYSAGARAVEAALCCPTSYDARLLAAIPDEVLERDYGCGDPTRHLHAGETVLDLGSGGGKICFLASQLVGPSGQVIGIDMNDDMLALARRNAPEVARRVGYANTTFKKGKIQDLRFDRDWLDQLLRAEHVRSEADLARLDGQIAEQRRVRPLVADASIDVVLSNCVLNLVRPEDKRELFAEIFRILRRGGRAIISDIVSDEDVPDALQQDPALWSGCISGALREDRFLAAFEEAGFYGVTLLERQAEPWRTVEGIEFRSMTVAAYKGKEGPCWDQQHAVLYRGPFRQVEDDDGHVFRRGIRTAVCEKTFRLFAQEPYRTHVELIAPRELCPLEEAPPFPCTGGTRVRHARETKGVDYRVTSEVAAATCEPNGSCC